MEQVHIRHDGIEGTAVVPESSLQHYTGHGWVVVPEDELEPRPAVYATPKATVDTPGKPVVKEPESPPPPAEANPTRQTTGRGNSKEN